MIDLNPNHLATVRRILAEHAPGCEVRAFGSRAKWTASEYSDLDLAVVGETELDSDTLWRLKDAFSESDLPILVDVLDWHAISDSFRDVIEVQYVVVQAASAAQPDALQQQKMATVGEFAPFTYGKGLPKKQRNSAGNVPVYGSNGIIGYHDEPLTASPTIIIGRKGTVGAIHYSPEPCWPIDTTFYVTDDDVELLRFKYYALQCLGLQDANGDSAVPGLNRDFAHSREIPLPPLGEQRRIAGVLGGLDDKIELNRRMGRTLEEVARALFRSWFVDFEPVRAKQAQRWSPGQSLPGLPAQLHPLFPDQLEPSPQGPIPQGWRVATLGEIATFVRESTEPQSSPDTVFEHYSIPAFDDGKLPVRQVGSEIKSAKLRVPPDAVLVSRLNPEIERVWLPPAAPGDQAVCSTEFLVLTPTPPFTRHYVYCLARSQAFRGLIESLVTGTSKSHQRARADAVLSLDVLVPPRPLVEAFGQQAVDLLDRALQARNEAAHLSSVRDRMLPRLMPH